MMNEPNPSKGALRCPKWYWLLFWCSFLIIFGTPLATMFAEHFLPPGPWNEIAITIQICNVLFLVLWPTWCCPWMDAAERSPRWTCEPKKHLRTLRILTWMPATIFGIITSVIVINVVTGPPTSGDTIESTIIAFFIFSFAALVSIAPPLVFHTSLRNLLQNRTFARNICFDCGYDLRMTTSGNCPECGAAIPVTQANAAQDETVSKNEPPS